MIPITQGGIYFQYEMKTNTYEKLDSGQHVLLKIGLEAIIKALPIIESDLEKVFLTLVR